MNVVASKCGISRWKKKHKIREKSQQIFFGGEVQGFYIKIHVSTKKNAGDFLMEKQNHLQKYGKEKNQPRWVVFYIFVFNSTWGRIQLLRAYFFKWVGKQPPTRPVFNWMFG